MGVHRSARLPCTPVSKTVGVYKSYADGKTLDFIGFDLFIYSKKGDY